MIAEAERRGLAAARRHDHRGHRRQHRRRPGHGRRRQGLPLHLRPARQDERREDPPAQGLRGRGRHHADRRRRPTRPRATTASPTAWPARSPAPGGPTSSPTSPTPRSTTAPPARKSGSRPTGKITAFVAGVGTGGTISGVGRYLKERNPDIKVIGADPEGSVLSGDSPQPWKVEGIGEDFVPKTFNSQVVDEWVRVGDAESFHVGPRAGPARGHAASAARAARPSPRPCATPAGCGRTTSSSPSCADTGRNYLSKFFDDALAGREQPALRTPQPAHSVGDLLQDARAAAAGRRSTPEATVAEAIELMQATGISQLPVLRRRQAGRQHPGGDAGPRPARPRRPEQGDGRRDHGPAAAAARRRRRTSTRRTGCCWPATPACWRSSDGQGGRHRHPDRPDPLLEPERARP